MRTSSMFRGVCALCLVSLALADSYGEYPTTYPFENEVDPPNAADLPDYGAPDSSNVGADDDQGGYFLHRAIKKSMADQPGPEFYAMGEGLDIFNFPDHLCKIQWNIVCSINIPNSNWNCTAKDIFHTADDFPGTFAGQTVCTDCCQEFLGHPKYGADQLDRLSTFSGFASTSGCGDITEEVYCSITDSWQWACMDNYITRSERLIMKVCFDGFVKFQRECALLKTAGATEFIKQWGLEPESYIDELSPDETFILNSLEFSVFDKVCYPYSYYHPETSAEESGSGRLTNIVFASLFSVSTVYP